MLGIFSPLQKPLKISEISIDNNVFRLHYKATVIFLLAFSLLVTSQTYIGDPIDCIVDSSIPASVMDTYCWIHSTFTIPNRLAEKVGSKVSHPGVGHVDEGDEIKYHKYYQWVCFFLFFQAVLFYIPRYIWKTWEGGRTKMLVMELNNPLVPEKAKNDRKRLLINYFKKNLHGQNCYAFRFFFCEVLNFANVIGQIYFMDTFLGGEFTTYGSDVVKFQGLDQEDRADPMAKVFPKVTKCTFHTYGASGTVQKHDGICVLPLNIVNEKIMVFLWFWFILVAAFSGLGLVYRLIVLVGSPVRGYLLRLRSPRSSGADLEVINDEFQVGDWFMLYQVSKNMEPMIFEEFIRELALAIRKGRRGQNV